MAKNKKRANADHFSRVRATATQTKKRVNPFEVHVNKEKFSILGRQLKHDKGMPGVSRGKALKRRKDTLGQEFANKNKTNKFVNKRIGGASMSREEAANARFMAEQLNKFKKQTKQSKYNLSDETVLTHKGQTMLEIEQFKGAVSEEEDTDEELGKLDEQFTSTAHFGGDPEDHAGGKDRKAAIDDLIAEQKRRKTEISKDKEEVQEMTELLDANWRSLIPLMGKLGKVDEVKPKPDDYDRALREMIFEPRGSVTDKLVSEQEMLKKEKERLEKLEFERQQRMEGITNEDKKMTHRSADDLDDGYFLQIVVDNKGNDGENEEDEIKEFENAQEEVNEKEENDEMENSEDEAEDEEDSESDDGEEEEDHDSLSDLKYSSEEEEKEETPIKRLKSENSSSNEKSQTDRKKIMEEAAAKLPFTFDLPNSYDDFEKLFENRTPEQQQTIFERMLKYNHPKVVPENKEKMTQLFAFTLQHLNDTFQDATATSVRQAFDIFHRLSPHIFDLFNINPVEMTKCFKDVIVEKQNDFRKQTQPIYPSLDTFVFLKLVPVLYSTSDYRHPIVTPCFLFVSQMLSRCKVRTRSDVASGLFLVALVLEYTKLSRRFLPAAVNFLLGVLFLAIEKHSIEVYKKMPPFKSTGELNSLLVINEQSKPAHFNDGLFLKSEDLLHENFDESFKIRAINSTLGLANEMLKILSVQYLIEPFEKFLEKLNFETYPKFVMENLTQLHGTMNNIREKPLEFPEPPVKRPKALRMMEPKFEKVYDDKRTRIPEAKPKAIRHGLQRKIKQETRGAIREIRRDNAFLTKIQLTKQLQSDAERREKVKRIFSEASIQQGELNALERKKKHL